MSKTLRKAMLSSVAMLLVGVLSLTGVTYAWFTSATSSEVKGINLTVESPAGGVLISEKKDSGWASLIELTDATLTGATPVSTVAADGEADEDEFWDFFTGEISAASQDKITTATAEDAEGAPVGYLRKTLFLKNEAATPVTVTLEGTSFTTASDNGDMAARIGIRYAGAWNGFNANQAGTAGEVKGKVSGTTQFAIFESNAGNHLDGSTGKKDYYGVKAESATPVNYKDAASNDTYFAAVKTEDTAKNIEITVPGNMITEIEVYVWVEGQDVDCINAIGGANLVASLKFQKQGTTQTTEPTEPTQE